MLFGILLGVEEQLPYLFAGSALEGERQSLIDRLSVGGNDKHLQVLGLVLEDRDHSCPLLRYLLRATLL